MSIIREWKSPYFVLLSLLKQVSGATIKHHFLNRQLLTPYLSRLTLETLWNESFFSLRHISELNEEEVEDEEEYLGKHAFQLLAVLAFCSPDSIPRDLFVRPKPMDPMNNATEAPVGASFCTSEDKYIIPTL